MKKCLLLVMAMVCAAAVFAGCAKKDAASSPSGPQMKDGQSVQTVVDRINTEIGIAMAADIEDSILKDVFYIDPVDVQAYAGKFAMVNTSADNVVAVQANPGGADAVKEALEKRLTDVQKSFEMYLPEQYAKSQKGQVIVKGDYVFLLILGESDETFDRDMEKAVSIINDAF